MPENTVPAPDWAAQAAALVTQLQSRAKLERSEAKYITPGFEEPKLADAALHEQAAVVLASAREQMEELNGRVATAVAAQAAAEQAVTEAQAQIAVLRAVTGTPASQW